MSISPSISARQNCADEYGQNVPPFQTLIPLRTLVPSDEINRIPDMLPVSCDRYSPEQHDYYEACLGYIHDILMEEEDSDDAQVTLKDHTALQATEKSFYDALYEPAHPSLPDQHRPFYDHDIQYPENEFLSTGIAGEPESWVLYQHHDEPFLNAGNTFSCALEMNSCSLGSISGFDENVSNLLADSPVSTLLAAEASSEGSGDVVATHSTGGQSCENSNKKSYRDNDIDNLDLRSNKHLASSTNDDDDCEVIHQFDDILLPNNEDEVSSCKPQSFQSGANANAVQKENQKVKRSRGRKNRAKKQSGAGEIVDLRSMLTHCAQAVASFDLKVANDLLKQIREHSSPYGDGIQRVAHYFANGLEARMAGTGSQLHFLFINSRIQPVDVLRSYHDYASAVPIFRTSFYLANKMIARHAEKATQIHVIDFGIYHGFQWPSLIQQLSERRNGPPKLRITGIDFPLNGFRPAEKVEQTGRRLKAYCDRFNVPFEYHPLAKTWETIQLEDFRIERDEMIMVNCQYRATFLLDETVEVNCPRDAFLRLIRKLNPDLFIHGTMNGMYGAPFFITRFREALFNYMSMFDIYEVTMSREDRGRLLLEQNLHGTEILNTVASEGIERVNRAETYKQWQVRTLRAGFVHQYVDKDIIERSKEIVKEKYHKDFVVDVDGHWMLQGWKGRILFAISCWKPAETVNR